MKKVLAFVLALVMVLSMVACGENAGKQGDPEKTVTKIRLAHDYSPETANSIGMQNFAKLGAEKSGGTIEIDIYSNGELSGRNSQGRLQIMPVRATVTGQPGIHKPQTVQQLRTCPECTPNSGNARSLMKGQCRRNMQNFINQSFRSLRHTPSGIS